MDEIVASFRKRADSYILQCDDLYGHLVQPFLVLKDPVFDDSDPPAPSYLESNFVVPDEPLPPDLFEL
jgi:hypothetical protein